VVAFVVVQIIFIFFEKNLGNAEPFLRFFGLCAVDIQKEILTKASELFLKYGIRSVSMDDIARELGMSKKTIYVHYQDKDALLMAFMHYQLDFHTQIFEKVRRTSSNVIDEILVLSGSSMNEMRKYHSTLIYDLQKYHHKVWQVFEAFKNENIYHQVKDQLLRGVESGYFRADIDVEIITKMHLQQINTILNPDIFGVQSYDVNKVFAQIFAVFLRGICTPKGLKLIENKK
jgi:AcrR family transcriptional regulator